MCSQINKYCKWKLVTNTKQNKMQLEMYIDKTIHMESFFFISTGTFILGETLPNLLPNRPNLKLITVLEF